VNRGSHILCSSALVRTRPPALLSRLLSTSGHTERRGCNATRQPLWELRISSHAKHHVPSWLRQHNSNGLVLATPKGVKPSMN
jgi:hypothetical protein